MPRNNMLPTDNDRESLFSYEIVAEPWQMSLSRRDAVKAFGKAYVRRLERVLFSFPQLPNFSAPILWQGTMPATVTITRKSKGESE